MFEQDIEGLDPRKHIIIKGARANNLKNVDLAIPRRKLVVITGLSGSGKSSLAFDTLYAEGQRRYVESLSSYARQFLGRLDKPEVDYIKGISPAIVVDQKVVSRSSRSTVGTSTEIYDYIKLLYARVGRTTSPVSGNEVKRHTPEDVLAAVLQKPEGSRFQILAPLTLQKDRSLKIEFDLLLQKGFSRIWQDGQAHRLDEDLHKSIKKEEPIYILMDRLATSSDDDFPSRLLDSVENAFYEGHGDCFIQLSDNNEMLHFSNRFELDGIQFEEPTPNFFSFNNPLGACKRCEGFGSIIGIDPNLVIPNKSLSVFEEAIVCWKGEKMSKWKQQLILASPQFDFPVHKPIRELSIEQYNLLWTGNEHFEGLNDFFIDLERQSYKIQYRVMLSRYRGKTTCPDCQATRIRKDANYVKIQKTGIVELVQWPVSQTLEFFKTLELSDAERHISRFLLKEIINRLGYLCDVGLGYLTLNRMSNTLSGGESQRINLSTCLGSSLVGSMYILDEPSIGLHSKDTERLIEVLRGLRDLGNTVIVVEHDEAIMKAADVIVDMGPRAGSHGGELVFSGNYHDLLSREDSLTALYLSGKMAVEPSKKTRKLKDRISLKGARANNLKNIDVDIPLRGLVAVTGVSGSGKSTLIGDLLYPAVRRALGEYSDQMGDFDGIEGDLGTIKAVEYVDQNPIGISSRSNPVTYVKAYDEIRALYASQPLAKTRSYKPSHFSFNVAGGRCETCEGEGQVTISMQFMADIKLDCESCGGKRFKDEILEVHYREKSIADLLSLTIDEAIEFFTEDESTTVRRLLRKIQPLQDVGLGYVQLGQPSSTLSGGEAQRIKLASYLSKGDRAEHTLFIFDEPTTGLHFDDINKLLDSFQALIAQGHSIVVIEHNIDVIKCSDWVIDLGPVGGMNGGYLMHTGTPQSMAENDDSVTGKFVKESLSSAMAH